MRASFTWLIILSFWLLPVGIANAEDESYPPAGETIVYKGVTLIGTTYEKRSSKKFFRYAKQAIDMVQSLPDEKWNKTELIKRIAYDPPSPQRKNNPDDPDLVTDYWVLDTDTYPATMFLIQNTRSMSGVNVALSMVKEGLRAHKHKLAYLMNRMAANDYSGYESEIAPELGNIKEIIGRLKAGDDNVFMVDRCDEGWAMYKAMQHIEPDESKRRFMRQILKDEKCG